MLQYIFYVLDVVVQFDTRTTFQPSSCETIITCINIIVSARCFFVPPGGVTYCWYIRCFKQIFKTIVHLQNN